MPQHAFCMSFEYSNAGAFSCCCASGRATFLAAITGNAALQKLRDFCVLGVLEKHSSISEDQQGLVFKVVPGQKKLCRYLSE